MRLFILLSIATLTATSGYTSPPRPVSRSLSPLEAGQVITCTRTVDQSERSFLTRDPGQPFIMMDPNGDSDEDGVINILDLHPNDSERWFEFAPIEVSEDIDPSGPLDPRELETGPDDRPLLL